MEDFWRRRFRVFVVHALACPPPVRGGSKRPRRQEGNGPALQIKLESTDSCGSFLSENLQASSRLVRYERFDAFKVRAQQSFHARQLVRAHRLADIGLGVR